MAVFNRWQCGAKYFPLNSILYFKLTRLFLQKLESLLLQNCFWMTVGAMEIFTHHLSPSLKIVDLTGCVRVSEGAIILLLSKQPK